MSQINKPIVKEINYSSEMLKSSIEEWKIADNGKYLLSYPTVYIINDKANRQKFNVYVGETADIQGRTNQHLLNDVRTKDYWQEFYQSPTSSMYVIGHHFFNKSLTLDIENKLMHFLSSVDNVGTVFNGRTNQQNEYYTSEKLDEIFSKIWRELHRNNKDLFPLESVIRDSAIFKASPFHKLTSEQITAKNEIISKVQHAVQEDLSNQLILVDGQAGSGKTVLMSSLFFELRQMFEKEFSNGLRSYLLVNHDEQLKVYEQIANKLGLNPKKEKVINKPTSFINNHDPEDKVDVVIVDEAHLLLTQGKQSYQGKNHLKDLIERAKVVVAVFDKNQILSREQVWEEDELARLINDTKEHDNYIALRNQMRINASEETVRWIRTLIDSGVVGNVPHDKKGYDIKLFDNPRELHEEIKKKSKDMNSGLSRLVATFDWPYNGNKKPEDLAYWCVKIDEWSLPWNKQLSRDRKYKNVSWAEQPQTIDEVGSTYTIQGADLNYVGVIIGPSVKYRNGQIIFDEKESENKKATQKRTLSNNEKKSFAKELLKNELNVLMTRGVNGLYIYAVDEALREVLHQAMRGELTDE